MKKIIADTMVGVVLISFEHKNSPLLNKSSQKERNADR